VRKRKKGEKVPLAAGGGGSSEGKRTLHFQKNRDAGFLAQSREGDSVIVKGRERGTQRN